LSYAVFPFQYFPHSQRLRIHSVQMEEPFARVNLEVQLCGIHSDYVTKQGSAIDHTRVTFQFTFPETSVQSYNVYHRAA
jgi:hypothetical protein